MKTVVLLALVAVASAASMGSQTTCCGPAEWEAMAVASAAYGYASASSKPMPGLLSLDHLRRMAVLQLISATNDTNSTMTVSINGSRAIVYFVVHRIRQSHDQQQPQPDPVCAAYVLKNVMIDLTSSCFPAGQFSSVDRLTAHFGQTSGLRGSLPVNLLAYEYSGLAGLIAVQMYANAADCSPTMFGLSTASDAGPLFSLMLSNINSDASDRSLFDNPPAECAQVTPIEIQLPKGNSNSRRGPTGPAGAVGSMGRGGKIGSGQWIDDLVTMYVLSSVKGATGQSPSPAGRRRRDLKDMVGLLDSQDQQPNMAQIVKSALALRYLLQDLSDFVGPVDGNTGRGPVGNSRGPNGRDSFDWGNIETLIMQKLMSGTASDMQGGDGQDGNDGGPAFAHSDLQTLAALLIEKNLLDGILPGQNSNKDDLEQLVSFLAGLQVVGKLADFVDHLVKYNIYDTNETGPGFALLLKLASLSAAADQRNRPDITTLFKLMAAQQQQQPDFSNLLKLLAAQQQQQQQHRP